MPCHPILIASQVSAAAANDRQVEDVELDQSCLAVDSAVSNLLEIVVRFGFVAAIGFDGEMKDLLKCVTLRLYIGEVWESVRHCVA